MSMADLALGDLTNDSTLLNGRHPGRSSGPHRIAIESEGNTCGRITRTITENYAAKIVV
jgi:hypothetical protein